ncbi:hypothetical protein HETIRDRAFT_447335 [Heterobasidion irregulare TC 32-1]|uniref:Uncharacterized protein n=1 Tax=Heterobasidion irregulare (strain TC 32-1) TaxID=747525 RepID=W4KLP9_HETIT|nr:uncharacterized protein HETIRDRAFT_447335 [Heterobasidion irregulare TC 32-1]ETW86639.1 hypothetical protein HETIRDRAFT_447335 [Heterobasidion irregulare TC 32-1]
MAMQRNMDSPAVSEPSKPGQAHHWPTRPAALNAIQQPATALLLHGLFPTQVTYSGIHVYETMCKDVAARTRVLEREVQKGEHERVQGGYGKYHSESLRSRLSPRLSCPDTSSPSHWPVASRHLDSSSARTAACQAVQLRPLNWMSAAKYYGDQILECFIPDSHQLPDILINPPADIDPNIAIDDD